MNPRIEYLREKTSKLTTMPGVYQMKNADGQIIYIGKAKNLRNRVTSYFCKSPDHTPKVAKMVENVYDYDFIVTDSEYEALVLECSMIKQHSPKYNILLKDDKGYSYIKISDEDFPRITVAMQKIGTGKFLGPYTSSYVAKQAVQEANRVFMLPTCKKHFSENDNIRGKIRPCLNYQIKRCMGVCQGKINSKDYCEIVEKAVEYIRDGQTESVEELNRQMEEAAENLEFERAAILRDRINAIIKAADNQKIIADKLPDTDVIAIAVNGNNACAAVIIYRNGRLYDRKEFFLGEIINDTAEMCRQFIIEYYQSYEIPKAILTEEEIPDREIIEQLLKNKSGHAISISQGKIGRPARLTALAKSNASEYLSIKVERTGKEIIALEALSKVLGLKKTPEYIESYDISNLGSDNMVAGMVVFKNGRPYKKAYKKFNIRNIKIQNDFASMAEVLERRFLHYLDINDHNEGFATLPDLILLDGGDGQVNAVKPVLEKLKIDVPVFGMVKDNKHRTRAISTGGEEISISETKNAFNLLTQIQDEVHRFSITFQRKSHRKTALELGLTSIKGIGEKKALKLLTTYKTTEKLKNAEIEQIKATCGISEETAKQVYDYLQEL